MTLSNLSQMFNAALGKSWNFKNLLLVFFALVIGALSWLFFQLLAVYAPNWLRLPLFFIPVFITVGLVMAAGGILTHLYYKQKIGTVIDFNEAYFRSWDIAFKASYFALPLLWAFTILWLLLCVFQLLKEVPVVGQLVSIFLASVPFLINVGIIFLFITAALIAFFIVPFVGMEKSYSFQHALNRVRRDFFHALVVFFIAVVPLAIALKVLHIAAQMSWEIYSFENSIHAQLQKFFILIPCLAIISPFICFFFNFSLETLWHHRQKAAGNILQTENV